MKTHRWLRAAPLVVLLLAGCGGGSRVIAPEPDGPAAEEAAAGEELDRHPDLIDDGLSESTAQVDASAGVAAAIDPLFFWRRILTVERTVTFAFGDTDSVGRPTTAVATVHKRFAGWFNLVAGDDAPEGSPTEGRLVRKPLRDHWVRRILLKRVEAPEGDRRRWRIAAVSGVKITSRDADTRIASLRVESGDLDTTVSDPLAFWRLRRLLRFHPEAEVRLTATTGASDDVVVLYSGDRRRRFNANGDGTYTITWSTRALAGVHHLGVNALSHGTLYDDEAPYDSQSWILPFVVVPTELADLAP